MYHFVCQSKYRKAIFNESVEQTFKDICFGISKRYKIYFLEIETDNDQVLFLIQSVPTYSNGQICGALIFGIGWAITGACPGPLFAQAGSGYSVVIVTILSAITGTWIYGKFRDKLPH